MLVKWLTIPLGGPPVVTRGLQMTAGIQGAFGLSCACMFAIAALGPRLSGVRTPRLAWAWTYLAIGIAVSAGTATVLREIWVRASGPVLLRGNVHISTLPILEIAFAGVAAVICAVLIHRVWLNLSASGASRANIAGKRERQMDG